MNFVTPTPEEALAGLRAMKTVGGAPEPIISHDLTHVLTGYDTDFPSEACITAFQSGYRRGGPFTGLLFVLLNMQKA